MILLVLLLAFSDTESQIGACDIIELNEQVHPNGVIMRWFVCWDFDRQRNRFVACDIGGYLDARTVSWHESDHGCWIQWQEGNEVRQVRSKHRLHHSVTDFDVIEANEAIVPSSFRRKLFNKKGE